MDKYEIKLKSDQMRALADEGEYAAAAEIADTINWRKIRNVNLLVKAGDIYSRQKRFEEAREILLMAYDRSPIGRMIIYRLAEIAIKMKNLEEAEEYYSEFVEIAPHDNLKYVLRYKISRAKGADLQTQIAILEELKEAEYTEEWSFRLAYLYHKAGESEKCIDACDELILWFGDGIYVERALELKMLYQPLTKSQEGKYRSFKQRRDGVKEVYPKEENVVRIPVVQENVEKFNTANLQEELAKSMQQIMDATEKETVDDTMDNIKRLVEEIPYLSMPSYEAAPASESERIEASEAIDDRLRDNFREMLSEDSEEFHPGMQNAGMEEPGAGGQMSIEDVLSGWEKTRRAAQAALQMAQQQKLESAKARALQEAGDIMERLADVIPKLDAGIAPVQMMEETYPPEDGITNEERAGRAMADMNDMLQRQIEKLQEEVCAEEEEKAEEKREPEKEEEKEPDLLRKIRQAKPNFDEQIGLRPYRPRQFALPLEETVRMRQITQREPERREPESGGLEAEYAKGLTDAGDLERHPVADSDMGGVTDFEGERPEATHADASVEWEPEENEAQEMDDIASEAQHMQGDAGQMAEPAEEMDITEEMRLAEAEFYGIPPEMLDTEQRPHVQQAETAEDESEALLLRQDTKEIKAKKIAEALDRQAKASKKEVKEEEAEAVSEAYPAITKLNEEQKAIFSYFVPVAGMERQICQALTKTAARLSEGKGASTGNILIQGGAGCGKTMLARALVRALQTEIGLPNGKVGKIDAQVLNKKELSKVMKKMAGGCLIIERAGGLSRETAVKLSLLLDQDESGMLLIMEDARTGLDQALSSAEGLAVKFTERIKIPVFTSDELVEFGKAYAHDLSYEIDAMGVLALYNRISNIQRLDQATTLTEVKGIIDEAIENAEKKTIKKAFSILTSRRYAENDYVLLREKDFEE